MPGNSRSTLHADATRKFVSRRPCRNKGLRRITAACAGIIASATVALAADKAPVMITPGAFSVSQTGAFTYSIPIAVPPGTAGMVPSLSLDYNSQGGNGIVGLGWTLSGLPAITRCPRTGAQDGNYGTSEHVQSAHGGIDYDSKDRFCLDGQRLIVVNGLADGVDGAEYRTEIDGFSKIISHTSGSNGPDWFEVWTKSGQHMQFGYTSDSRVMALGTSIPRVWAVNRINDTKQNYLMVTYTDDFASSGNGQFYPSEIDYTGNTTAGLAPYNSVKFTYENRPEFNIKFEGGYSQNTTVRLAHIRTYAAASPVSDYTLTYNADLLPTRNSELQSVQLCDGASPQTCLPATTFGWQGTRDTLSYTARTLGTGTGQVDWGGSVSTDWNGDGLSDSFDLNVNWLAGDGTYAPLLRSLQNLDGTFSSSTQNLNLGGTCYCQTDHNYYFLQGVRFAPVFGGPAVSGFYMTETVQDTDPNDITSTNDTGLIYLNNGTGTLAFYSYSWPGSYNPVPGDFDGDGRADFWLHYTVGSTPYSGAQLGNGDGSFTTETQYTPTNIGANIPTFLGDFNGDGCTDILTQSASNHNIYFECDHTTHSVSVTNWAGYLLVIGDFNGDGKADVLAVSATTTGSLNFGTGSGFALSSYTVPAGWGDTTNYEIVTGDWNGDGKTDLALIKKTSGGSHQFYLSNGNGFTSALSITNSGPSVSPVVGDWNADGASDIVLNYGGSGTMYTFSFVPELIASVNNGLNTHTFVSYDRINKAGTLYTPETNAAYPARDLTGPLYVVSRVDSSNGRADCTSQNGSNCYASDYSYSGAKANLLGRGFLGFHTVSITDVQTTIVQTTVYLQDFPYIGLVDTQTKKYQGTILSSVTNTYCDTSSTYTGCVDTSGQKTWFVFLRNTVQAGNDIDFPTVTTTTLPTVTTSYGSGSSSGYDSYGNVLQITVQTRLGSETATKVTTNDYYDPDTTNWILGRLKDATTTASYTGVPDITRTSSFDYYGDGLLDHENIEPSDTGTLKLTTQYTYDTFGNKIEVAVTGNDGNNAVTRITQTTYESTYARFPQQITNALSQSESWGYDARFGLPTSQTGPNGIQTNWIIDSFGRKTSEQRFVGLTDTNSTVVAYNYCSGYNGGTFSCPTAAAFAVTAMPQHGAPGGAQNGPESIVYYDRLSRVVAVDAQGFCSSSNPACWIRTDTQYDANGRIQRVSQPCFITTVTDGCPADTEVWTTNNYDVLGRAYSTTAPNGGTVSTAFHGLTTTVTATVDGIPADNQATTTVKNVLGVVKQITDANGRTTTNGYDAYGDLIQITDSLSSNPNITRYSYDTRGRKIYACEPDKIAAVPSSCDPSAPAADKWSFTYDAFGELLTQTDAKGQITTLTYDTLGRASTRGESGLYSTWTYGTAAGSYNVGKLTQAKACTSSAACTGADLKAERDISYDSYGRPTTVTLTVGGASQGSYTTTYNSDQRINTVTYPSGFEVQYSYTSYGFVYQLSEYGTSNPLWTALGRDALQHVTSEQTTNRANGNVAISTTRIFDPNTGLPSRITANGTPTTSGALVWSATANPCTANCWGGANWGSGNVLLADFSYSYDYLGKMLSLSDAATSATQSFCYDALDRLTSYAPASTCTGSGTVTVAYNEIGNITEKSDVCASAGCYAYPSSGGAQPHAISSLSGTFNGSVNPTFSYDSNGNMTSGAGRSVTYTAFNMAAQITDGTDGLCWTYDADHQRVRMDQVSSCGGSAVSTTYYLNDSVSGLTSEKIVSGSNTTTRDYLIVAGVIIGTRTKINSNTPAVNYYVLNYQGSVAVTTDEIGNLVCRITYDPWGKSTASGSSCAAPTREFLGQESINTGAIVNLVNLNARIYDPVLGRFMAPDPVSDFSNPQGLNLYTYGLNSPLWLSDPSGMCFLGCFWKQAWFAPVASIVAAVTLNYWALPALEADVGIITVGEGSTALASASAGTLTANAAIAGGISGAISTGSLKGALLGAFQGAAFSAIGDIGLDLKNTPELLESAGLHGLVGGLTSAAAGGNFGSGFLAAGFSGLAAPAALQTNNVVAGTAMSAVIGGVASVLGGGKFENGAETGAFGYLFNDLAHDWARQGAAAGAIAGGVVVSAGCDAVTDGACVLASPETFAVGAVGGGGIGYAMGYAAGAAADQVDRLVHGNSYQSMQGTEVYYLINNTTGEIDKIGITSYGESRYSQGFYERENVFYETQAQYQWRLPAAADEFSRLMMYQAAHGGDLPRLNKVPR